jgi:hypothetical protein
MIMNGEYVRIGKEVAVHSLKLLCLYLSETAEENHKNGLGVPVIQPGI